MADVLQRANTPKKESREDKEAMLREATTDAAFRIPTSNAHPHSRRSCDFQEATTLGGDPDKWKTKHGARGVTAKVCAHRPDALRALCTSPCSSIPPPRPQTLPPKSSPNPCPRPHMIYHTIPYHTMPCHIILYCTMSYRIIRCSTVLYHAVKLR